MVTQRRWDLHINGVHTECRKPTKPTGGAVGIRPKLQDQDRPDGCMKAGKVERLHGHDFDGPLWAVCRCDEEM